MASSGPNRDRRGYIQSGSGSHIRIKDAWDTDSVQAAVVSDVEAVPMQLLFLSPEQGRLADVSNGITKTTQVSIETMDRKPGKNHTNRNSTGV